MTLNLVRDIIYLAPTVYVCSVYTLLKLFTYDIYIYTYY